MVRGKPHGLPGARTLHDIHPGDLDWMRDARCTAHDPELFFPLSYESNIRQAAISVCARCPVAAACGQYAWNNGIRDGIWGGMTPIQRYRYYTEREHGRMLRYWRQQALVKAVEAVNNAQ